MIVRHFGLSSRTAHDGGAVTQSGSRGVTQYHADSISLSPSDRQSGRALLKRGYVAQALIDSTAVLFCFLFLLSSFSLSR